VDSVHLNSLLGTIPAKFVKRSRAFLSCEVCKTKQGLLQSGSTLAKQSLKQQGYGGLGPLNSFFGTIPAKFVKRSRVYSNQVLHSPNNLENS
jgi:hypothetical protein